MEGPTPVSALIHAATMVAAGIFLLARISFLLTVDARLVILCIGAITMVIGAVKALRGWDIKKVLAYSTMSQLGLMVMAVGFGSWQTALFHLATHAFFKAGLFLSAGSVIHAVTPHEEQAGFDPQDMRTMGGLRKALPLTFICFSICAAALAGLPFFSGFLSKDAIITEGFLWAAEFGALGYLFPVLVIASAGLTAFYMTRQVWLVFFGEKRFPAFVHPHESPMSMWLPMALLSVLSLFFWFSFNPFNAEGWFLHWIGQAQDEHLVWVPFVASAVTFISIFLAYRQTTTDNPFRVHDAIVSDDATQHPLNWLHGYSTEHYFIIPFEWITRHLKAFEKNVVDAFVNLVAKGSLVFGHFIAWVDRMLVDGAVHLTVFSIRSAGQAARNMQSGQIQSYYIVTVMGVFLLILWLVVL